jgi:hypothetical protein
VAGIAAGRPGLTPANGQAAGQQKEEKAKASCHSKRSWEMPAFL